ncbi:HTH-type transcriptional regulator BetI [subsurface metagenome]
MKDKIKSDKDKKKRIIKSAIKIFSQKGYGPIVLDEIAREADIAKGTLYLYFQDKKDLVYHTILYVLDTIENALQNDLKDSKSPFEKLERIAFNQLSTFQKNPDFFGLFFILCDPKLVSNREKLFKLLWTRQNNLLHFETSVLKQAQKQGLISKELDCAEIAHLFNGMITSAIHRLKFEPSGQKLDIPKTVHTLIRVLLEGISTGRPV